MKMDQNRFRFTDPLLDSTFVEICPKDLTYYSDQKMHSSNKFKYLSFSASPIGDRSDIVIYTILEGIL
jgi:hypothetical protein